MEKPRRRDGRRAVSRLGYNEREREERKGLLPSHLLKGNDWHQLCPAVRSRVLVLWERLSRSPRRVRRDGLPVFERLERNVVAVLDPVASDDAADLLSSLTLQIVLVRT